MDKAKKIIEDKVAMIIGVSTGGGSTAAALYAERVHVPMFFGMGGEPDARL